MIKIDGFKAYLAGQKDGADAERYRILTILRAVSPNAGPDCKLLLSELMDAIEGDAKPNVISEADAVRDFENRYPMGKPRRR